MIKVISEAYYEYDDKNETKEQVILHINELMNELNGTIHHLADNYNVYSDVVDVTLNKLSQHIANMI